MFLVRDISLRGVVVSRGLCVLLIAAAPFGTPVLAAITTSGDVAPTYPPEEPDPWIVGGDLRVGSSAAGEMTIDGGSSVQVSQNLIVGNNGMGTLTVSSGDVVSNQLYVGNNNMGTLIISNGANVATTQNVYIGNNSGASGSTVSVTGVGSSWTSGFLAVGQNGEGTLVISNGGRVHANSAWESSRIGQFSTGSVMVSGMGSMWTNSGDLIVGHFGTGTLTIASGANVSNTKSTIGSTSTGNGAVTVTGPVQRGPTAAV